MTGMNRMAPTVKLNFSILLELSLSTLNFTFLIVYVNPIIKANGIRYINISILMKSYQRYFLKHLACHKKRSMIQKITVLTVCTPSDSYAKDIGNIKI